jgi:hypothetical protein
MEHVQTDAYLPRSTSLRQEEMTQKIDKWIRRLAELK